MSASVTINGKKIDLISGNLTAAKLIHTLGYIYHSAEFDKEKRLIRIDATKEDHENLLFQIESANIFLLDSIGCTGEALVAIDQAEISTSSVKNIGYLVSGLSDLLSMVDSTRDLIETSLRAISEQEYSKGIQL